MLFPFFLTILEHNLKQWCKFWRYERNCRSGIGWFYFVSDLWNAVCLQHLFSKVWYPACWRTWLPSLFPYMTSIAAMVESKPVFVVCLLNAGLLPCWKGQSSILLGLLIRLVVRLAQKPCSLNSLWFSEAFGCLGVSSAYATELSGKLKFPAGAGWELLPGAFAGGMRYHTVSGHHGQTGARSRARGKFSQASRWDMALAQNRL